MKTTLKSAQSPYNRNFYNLLCYFKCTGISCHKVWATTEGEGHSKKKNVHFFVNANRNLASLATHQIFCQCRFSLWNFSLKNPKFCHFEQYSAVRMRFRDFISSDKFLLNYHSGKWLLLSRIIFSQTCSKLRNDSIEGSEVDNRLEKFCWPCGGCQVSSMFFSFPPISCRTEWRHINTTWLPRHFQNGGLRSRFFFETNFSGIAGTSEAESSVSVRAECLLAKKSFFERPSP